MIYNLSIIVVYIVELLISIYFFSQLCSLKITKPKMLAIGVVLHLSSAALNLIFSNLIINFIAFLITNFLFAKICFNIDLNKSIFYSILLNILSISTEFASIFIISAITNTDITSYKNDSFSLILDAMFCKTLYFLLSVIVAQFAKKEDKQTIKIPPLLYLYPLSVGMVHLVFWDNYLSCNLSKKQCILTILTSIVLLFSTIFLFILYQHNIEKENNLVMLKNELDKIKLEKNYYDILDKQNEELLIYAHDAKNHLSIIKDLNNDLKIEKYIESMSNQLNSYSKICHSGNHTLDIIINKYQTECKIKNIDFQYDLKLANFKYINDYDLVTIFSNILDNAVESAENTDERKIELFSDHKNTYDILVLTNSSNKKHKSAYGEYLTTKESKSNHGFGLKSVAKTVKKYSGDIEVEYDENIHKFTTTIMLYNP